MIIETDRLRLRQWKKRDREPFSVLNSDSEVMQYFPALLNKFESDAMLLKFQLLISKNGWGFWACELKDSGEFIGFIGLHAPEAGLPFEPCIEIGWRIAKKYWGCGYATEAAQACVDFGFKTLNLESIVSFAVKSNSRSIAVMERIGMSNTNRNFEHPKVNVSHLKEHVLYEIHSNGSGSVYSN